jgi:hypothetical protein
MGAPVNALVEKPGTRMCVQEEARTAKLRLKHIEEF